MFESACHTCFFCYCYCAFSNYYILSHFISNIEQIISSTHLVCCHFDCLYVWHEINLSWYSILLFLFAHFVEKREIWTLKWTRITLFSVWIFLALNMYALNICYRNIRARKKMKLMDRERNIYTPLIIYIPLKKSFGSQCTSTFTSFMSMFKWYQRYRQSDWIWTNWRKEQNKNQRRTKNI